MSIKQPIYHTLGTLDREWLILMFAAKNLNISPEEIRKFIKDKGCSNNTK